MALQGNARNKQKSRQWLVIGIIGIVVLGGLAFFMLSKPDVKKVVSSQETKPRPPGKVAVPVVSRPIPLGGKISGQNIRINYYAPAEVPTDAVIALNQFANRRSTRALNPGDYIRDEDIAAEGAPKGYSGLATNGRRIVVLNANLFPGALSTISIGDHVDLLAISTPPGSSQGGSGIGSNKLYDSGVSIQGGGTQPGDPNSAAAKRGRARAGARAGAGAMSYATTATLIAEDAQVIAAPKKGKNTEFVVMQMDPQDAHVTILSAASGATMRMVFRPFNDQQRITGSKDATMTTRNITPLPDPDSVTVIVGGQRVSTKPLFLN